MIKNTNLFLYSIEKQLLEVLEVMNTEIVVANKIDGSKLEFIRAKLRLTCKQVLEHKKLLQLKEKPEDMKCNG